MTLRNERVRKALMKEIADVLQKDIKTAGLVSVMDVEVAHDNSLQKFFIAFLARMNKSKRQKNKSKNIPKN